MSRARVSIIVPVYNRESMIADCLDSVLAQDYAPIEVLVIDDGSTDGTAAVLARYADRVRILQQENAGPYVARNRALEEASGAFVCLVDSDDRIHPQKTRRQVARLEADPGVVLVYTHCAYRDPGGARRVPGRSEQVSLRGDLSVRILAEFGGNIPWPTAMIRAEALRKVGPFDTRHRVGMDRELGMRLAQVGRFDVIEEALYEFTLHAEHVSLDFARREEAARHVWDTIVGLEPMRRDPSLVRRARAKMHLQLAHLAYGTGAGRSSRQHLAAAVRSDPSLGLRPPVMRLVPKAWLGRDRVRRLGRLLGRRQPQRLGALEQAAPVHTPEDGREQRIAVVTPARDEGEHIEGLLATMAAQSHPPALWVIVDDGSTDDTSARVRAHLGKIPFLRLEETEAAGPRATGGRVVAAFERGLSHVDLEAFDFVVKLDADLLLPPDYFARLLQRFADDPLLGIAGGTCFLEEARGLVREQTPEDHVRGALKMYRRETFRQIGGLCETLGWDTIDEIRAMMAGWRTHSFGDLQVIHRRPTASVGGILRGRRRQGETAWRLGYHPLYMLARCGRVALREKPFLIGGGALGVGFLRAALEGCPRAVTGEEMAYVRRRQLARLRGRRPPAPTVT